MEAYQNYQPSAFQQNTNTLYSNYFRFTVHRLPDLTFFAQSIQMPAVSSTQALQATPFSTIHHTGDHLLYSTFTVTYLVDARCQNYFSLYYWMKGYGFPHSFEEVTQFRESQLKQMGNFRAQPGEIERTSATLHIVTPDTGAIIAEFTLDDVFPTELSALTFDATVTDATVLTTAVTLNCSNFELKTYTI